mmetsp:Transcript_32643/g.23593  ORF Transcript_32643/g.23593 Transcript_32643/m.23593 type:complete len:87 (+) Transcript_32643:73-333(+)
MRYLLEVLTYSYSKEETLLKIENINKAIDLTWTMIVAIQIFMMQTGFAMLETGAVRKKNSSNILLKNLVDTCVGAITFYMIGFGFS